MAVLIVNPNYQFDLTAVNLYWYSINGYNSDTLKNINVVRGGTTYADAVYIQGYDGFDRLELEVLGYGTSGIPLKGISGGTIQYVAEYDLSTGAAMWSVSGISLSAVSLYNAGLTASNSDELALIGSALAGNDSITLSNQADFMNGFGGNDVILGLGGNDTIVGGAGSDSIDGGSGIDVSVYAVARSAASISRDAIAHTLVVSAGADGVDTLRRIEQVKFSDGLASFAFTNPGAAVVANFNPANGWASQNNYPRHIADMNGDGFADIVGFGTQGVLVSYGSANGTFSNAGLVLANFGQTAGWTSDNQFSRALADLNGDGRADVVGFGYAGTLVSLAKSDGTFTAVATGLPNFGFDQGWTNQNGFARIVGDVNGDGKADIVGFGYAGALVALGNGDGTFQAVKTGIGNFGVNQGWNNDQAFHRALADVNGDGRADIVGFGSAGTYVALANGDGTFSAAQLATANFGANQGWTNNDTQPRFVADVNHDGRADIVGFGASGTYIAFGNGNGTFSEVSLDVLNFGSAQGWSSDDTYHRELADLNHDGLIDIVGFGIAGVLVGYNQGDFFA